MRSVRTVTLAGAAMLGAALLTACEPGNGCSGAAEALPLAVDSSTIPTQAEPGPGDTYVDATHGTCVTRLTDHEAAGVSGFIRNDYSRRQAFNADDTRLVVYVSGGTWRQLDATTGADLGQLPGLVGDAEPQWHPTDPDVLHYLPDRGGMTILRLDVTTGASTIAGDLTGRLPWPEASSAWTGSEGSPSADGASWAFMVEDAAGDSLGMVVWDLPTDSIVATYDFASNGVTQTPDYVSMSPTGRHVVAGYTGSLGVMAYTRDFSEQVQLAAQGEHSDLALLPDDRDAYVALDFEATGGPVQYTDIDDAIASGTSAPVTLFDTYLGNGSYTSIHFSAKSFARPGWVLASTYGGGGPQRWYSHRLIAIELAPEGRVLGLAHHHGAVSTYFHEIHASVNRTFTQVVFNTNWGGGGVDVHLLDDLVWIPDAER